MAGPLETGDLDDDLPPLVGEDGEEVGTEALEAGPRGGAPGSGQRAAVESEAPRPAAARPAAEPDGSGDEAAVALPGGVTEAQALRAATALRAAALLEEVQGRGLPAPGQGPVEPISAEDAVRGLLAEAQEPRPQAPKEPDEKTLRMVKAISKDDFEECEVAIMQGADVNADCGAGMRALHITALRGEMFLTELLIAHGANVNERDMSGNTPLLYACHFYRQHQRGVQLVSQLLHHKADPFYRVKDGKLAGKTAHDLMEKACGEPNADENMPRQMRAMLQLAMEGKEECHEAITKMWVHFKSQNKKLYQVSSKNDNYGYAMKSIDWELPENAKSGQAYAPVRLQDNADSILEERFTYLQDYSFTDEGDKVKVYVTFPESAASALGDKSALQVDFELQSLDLKLRTPTEAFRLRVEPLFGSVEVAECKHRVSAASRKVTLTLVKRHKSRIWPAIQKPR